MVEKQSDITVKLDDRIRLLSAALAITDFPDKQQEKKRHHPHAHARLTQKTLASKDLNSHPAIKGLQGMLDQNVPLEAIYTLVMYLQFPGLAIAQLPPWVPVDWNKQLWDFYQKAELKEFWESEDKLWQQAESQSKRAFKDIQFREFMKPFVSTVPNELIFIPNISFPANIDIGIQVGNSLIAIIPPPQAWGESPPWPYDEDTLLTHSYRAALTQYGRVLLTMDLRKSAADIQEVTQQELPLSDQFKARHPTWEDQFVTLFMSAVVAIYLEDFVDKREAKAHLLMEKKVYGMAILPGTVSVLRRYLQEYGTKYMSLMEFLPKFQIQLRVAKRMMSF